MPDRQPWATDDWVATLRQAVAEEGTRRVAEQLDCSRTLVSQLVNARYSAPIEKWRRRVEATFDRDEVPCPVLGAIPPKRCARERSRGFSATSPLRVRLSQTCPTCRFNPDNMSDTDSVTDTPQTEDDTDD